MAILTMVAPLCDQEGSPRHAFSARPHALRRSAWMVGTRDGHARTLISRDSRANAAASLALVKVLTYGRAARMPLAVGS